MFHPLSTPSLNTLNVVGPPAGAGPRMCIGYKFAVEEAVLTLARLYRQYTFRLVSEAPLELRLGITLSPKWGVPVYVQERAETD